jgi:hypothetical protein
MHFAFFTHLRIVFNLNLVNIKRLPPLIYHFNFSELFFTLFKKKAGTCDNRSRDTSFNRGLSRLTIGARSPEQKLKFKNPEKRA